jgi:hypothetical protein
VYRYLSGRLLDGTGGYLTPAPGAGGGGGRAGSGRLRASGSPAPTCGERSRRRLPPTLPSPRAACSRWLPRAGRSQCGRPGAGGGRGAFTATYTKPTLAALAPILGDAPVSLHVDPSLGTLMTRLVRPASPAEQWIRERYARRLEPAVRWLPDRLASGREAVVGPLRPAAARVREALTRPGQERGPRIRLEAVVPYLTPDQRQAAESVIGAKLPAGELVGSWDQVGQRVSATWTVRKRPPSQVGYADLAARFDQLADDEFFLGLAANGKPKVISLSDDAPHIALSAGSGAGKSVLAKVLAVQMLARGGRVVILDRKGSHRWALGMPGVDYCTRPEQMHNALLKVAKLADERNDAAPYEPEGWVPGERYLVIAEELNATMSQIKLWWDEVREKHEPKTPPAITAFRNLLFMGRSAFIHVLAIAQMLSALAAGGPEARENFGIRCLARYTKNNWQMLCDGVAMPRPSRTMGRWQVVVQGEATETQICYLTDAEARLFVAKYRGVSTVPNIPTSPLMAAGQGFSQGTGESRETADPMGELIGLREATEQGAVPWNYETARKRLRKARKSGAAAPAPVRRSGTTDLYRLGDLIAWAEGEMVP